jgi:prepilin-type processing-associated H-X9-DG protein
LRSAFCPPAPDNDKYLVGGSAAPGLAAGSNHSAIFNVAFCDGSVKGLSFEIELETFNQLAHRSDGDLIDIDQL